MRREFLIDGVVETEYDNFIDMFILYLESIGSCFGGGIREITETEDNKCQ